MNQEIRISHLKNMKHLEDKEHSNFVETIKIDSLEHLGEVITTVYGWAPGIFRDGTRNNASFFFTQIMGLDIDSGLTLTEAIELFKGYKHVIATTKSHQKDKVSTTGKITPACDRFRVILFLDAPITTIDIYHKTWFDLFEKYSFIDKACKDPARFFYKSTTVVSINKDGKLISPILEAAPKVRAAKPAIRKAVKVASQVAVQTGLIKGSLSLATRTFLANGADDGSWNISLFKAAKDMQEQGFSFDEAINLFMSMTCDAFSGSLDEKDIVTIKSAFKTTPKYAPRMDYPVMTLNSRGQSKPDANHPDNMKFLISNILNMKPAMNELKSRIYLDSKPFNDFDLSNIRIRCREAGINAYKEGVVDVLNELGRENSFHPFKQVVDSVVWDGQDHIKALYDTIEIEDEHLVNRELYHTCLRRWLIGVVAKVEQPGSQNMVLTFKGGQGLGKSRWLSKLNIAQDIFGEGSINPESKDDQSRHLDYVIWHASELDGITKKRESAALKDFFTKSEVNVRRPYDRFETIGKSCLSFCASVNEGTFLNDLTGNRRYLILPIKSLNPNHTVDMLQVFAQAKALFTQGESWWFEGAEIVTINSINEEYVAQNRVDHLASQVNAGTEWLSSQAIFEQLDPNFKYNQGDLTKLGMLLKRKDIQSTRKTVNGVKMTVYLVRSPNKFASGFV